MFIYRADILVNETLRNLSSRGNQPNEIIIIEFEIIALDTVIATCKTSIFFNKFSSGNATENCTLRTYHGQSWGVNCQYIGTFEYKNNQELNGLFNLYRYHGGPRTLMMLNTDLFVNDYIIVNSYNYDTFVPNKNTNRTILASLLVESHRENDEIVMKEGIANEHVLISNDILPVITMEFTHYNTAKAISRRNIYTVLTTNNGSRENDLEYTTMRKFMNINPIIQQNISYRVINCNDPTIVFPPEVTDNIHNIFDLNTIYDRLYSVAVPQQGLMPNYKTTAVRQAQAAAAQAAAAQAAAAVPIAAAQAAAAQAAAAQSEPEEEVEKGIRPYDLSDEDEEKLRNLDVNGLIKEQKKIRRLYINEEDEKRKQFYRRLAEFIRLLRTEKIAETEPELQESVKRVRKPSKIKEKDEEKLRGYTIGELEGEFRKIKAKFSSEKDSEKKEFLGVLLRFIEDLIQEKMQMDTTMNKYLKYKQKYLALKKALENMKI